MDSWSDKQIMMMRMGGNDKCNQFLKKYGVAKDMPIPQKYNTPAALLYRDRISAEVEGRPLPTELPTVATGSVAAGHCAQGTDPLPGETEAQYVARQRKLQEEARERMRQKFGASNGLSSSGKMAGIGSNPNYNPNQQSGMGGLDLSEAGQRAYSIFSSSLTMLGETVSSAGTSGGGSTGAPSQTWSMLSSGAADLWKSAAVATSDIVNIITAPVDEEAELRFPRPPADSDNRNINSNTGAKTGSSSAASKFSHKPPVGLGQGNGSCGRAESWDDLGDLLETEATASDNGKREFGYKGTAAAVALGSVNGKVNQSQSSDALSKQVSGLRLADPAKRSVSLTSSGGSSNSIHSLDGGTGKVSPPGSGGLSSRATPGTPSSGGLKVGSAKTSVSAPSPVGDDFFATFGI